MLIIFDLDDTLIPTSDMITPWRFQKIIYKLKLAGYAQVELDEFYVKLIDSHKTFSTSTQALEFYLGELKIDAFDKKGLIDELNCFDESMPVVTYPGVHNLLSNVKKRFKLALVTAGEVSNQSLKIQKAGLDQGFFDHIDIVESGHKEPFYKNIYDKFSPSSVLVVGDRVSKDLSPAKNLGFTTVLVRQGRGLFQKIHKDIVDFVIQDVTELENLIKSYQNP